MHTASFVNLLRHPRVYADQEGPMPKQPKTPSVPERETGNWSGLHQDKQRPGNEDDKQGGQREYTEPSRKDINSSDNPG